MCDAKINEITFLVDSYVKAPCFINVNVRSFLGDCLGGTGACAPGACSAALVSTAGRVAASPPSHQTH